MEGVAALEEGLSVKELVVREVSRRGFERARLGRRRRNEWRAWQRSEEMKERRRNLASKNL